MSIVVVGGGAIGLLVASRLAQSAQHVALLARPATIESLQTHALQVRQRNESWSVSLPHVAPEPHALPADYLKPDLAILCIKGYSIDATLPTLEALRPWQLLTLQNGIGHEETLAATFGADKILAGTITSSVQFTEPHSIQVTRTGGIGLAPMQDTPGLRVWGAVFSRAGFKVREYADYRAMKWSKLLLNIMGNAIPAILDMSVKSVYADASLLDLERQAWLEALTVMQQQGLQPHNLPGYRVKMLTGAMRKLPDRLLFPFLQRAMTGGGRGGKLPSLHADLRAGRPQSEGAYLYGAVACAAREAGLEAPVNERLWQVLNDIVTGAVPWDHFQQQPARFLDMVTADKEPSP